MPGFVVDSSAINMDDTYTKLAFVPASGANYFALTRNNVTQTTFDRRSPFYISINWLAQMYNDGPAADNVGWGVIALTAP